MKIFAVFSNYENVSSETIHFSAGGMKYHSIFINISLILLTWRQMHTIIGLYFTFSPLSVFMSV
jgi:hypothetical protein